MAIISRLFTSVVQSAALHAFSTGTRTRLSAFIAMASKKRKRLTFEQKQKVIDVIKSGAKKDVVCSQYGIGLSTLNCILKAETEIKERSIKFETKKKRCLSTSKFDIIEEGLLIWIHQQREMGNPINGPIIQQCALQLHENMIQQGYRGPPFKASNGWLDKFKKRAGIRPFKVKGEKSPDSFDSSVPEQSPSVLPLEASVGLEKEYVWLQTGPECSPEAGIRQLKVEGEDSPDSFGSSVPEQSPSELPSEAYAGSEKAYDRLQTGPECSPEAGIRQLKVKGEKSPDSFGSSVPEQSPSVLPSEAYANLEKAYVWLQTRPECSPEDLLTIVRLQDLASQIHANEQLSNNEKVMLDS